jgi:signal transduction histidine kinase
VAGFSKERITGLIAESIMGLKHYIFIISGIILLVGVGGAVLLAKVLTTPLRNLKGKMERVRSGDLDVTANLIPADYYTGYPTVRGDEISELIETFNDMVVRLRDSLEELDKSNREKARFEKLSALGEMSMTVAHEVKNPLNAIRGAVSYLKDNFEGEVLREFLSIIEEETARLNEIVTQYLVFSKPTPLKLQNSDLNRAVTDVVNLVRQEATENNIEMVMHIDETANPFRFDPQQMKQALLNILINALDATRPGDTIRITTAARDGHFDVIIQDTGQGISEETLAEIFKPFYTTKTRGSGLGLVRDHHGEIFVKTDQGKGTEFIISLPMEHGS